MLHVACYMLSLAALSLAVGAALSPQPAVAPSPQLPGGLEADDHTR
jgi:hypothetical protein